MTRSNAAVYDEPKIEIEDLEVADVISLGDDWESYNGELG